MTIEEEDILRAKQLDLIYSQSGILYEIIIEASRPVHNVEKPKPGPHVDGALEEISTQNGPFNFYSNSMSSCVSQ